MFILIIAGLWYIISFPFNEWFSETMVRHQLLQLPSMLALGLITGWWFSKYFSLKVSNGIAALIFIMASLIFWMLPHSIDLAVIDPSFNRVMHFNMIIAGFFFAPAMKNMIFEIKIIFPGMITAMLIATGITLLTYDMLLCSAFNIEQQKETGLRLIFAGAALFITTLVFFFRESVRK